MHPLIARQLNKAFAGKPIEGEPFATFVAAVNAAYNAADEDRKQLEHSLNLASDELYERNQRLELELEERKRLEVELRLAEKLRAVGLLAAGIAHEINTPVQFISDSLYFLRDAFDDLQRLHAAYDNLLNSNADSVEPAKAAVMQLREQIDLAFVQAEIPQALTRSREGTQRVTKIVRALKELAHPDTTTHELADINASIENTLIITTNEFKYIADIELDLAANQPVICNIGEIQQVLLNLIVNAAHAVAARIGESGERGKIRLATYEDHNDFVITVGDNGTGMPAAVRDRIFEPFFTTKPVGKGTGQGLSISRSLVVERHGGQLTFESVEGEGTTFIIRLPIAGKAALAA